jgi:hypothetical protein
MAFAFGDAIFSLWLLASLILLAFDTASPLPPSAGLCGEILMPRICFSWGQRWMEGWMLLVSLWDKFNYPLCALWPFPFPPLPWWMGVWWQIVIGAEGWEPRKKEKPMRREAKKHWKGEELWMEQIVGVTDKSERTT